MRWKVLITTSGNLNTLQDILRMIAMVEELKKDYEAVMSTYYGDDTVSAIITVKVDTKEAEQVSLEIAKFESVEDVLLVTGDTDIVAKVHFKSYRDLKNFVIDQLAVIPGIKDTKTLMIVTAYKEHGKIKSK